MKIYYPKKIAVGFFLFMAIFAAFIAPFMLMDKYYVFFFGEIILVPIMAWLTLAATKSKIIISSDSIIKSIDYLFCKRTYELKFNEVGMISDDSNWLFPFPFPGTKMFVFHLIPKEGIKKKFKLFTITAAADHPLEILKEVISKVDKDTEIAPSLLERLAKAKEKKKSSKT